MGGKDHAQILGLWNYGIGHGYKMILATSFTSSTILFSGPGIGGNARLGRTSQGAPEMAREI